MSGRFFLATLTALAFASSILSLTEEGAAKTAGEFLAEINRLPEIDRQARLERESRKDGNIVWDTGKTPKRSSSGEPLPSPVAEL